MAGIFDEARVFNQDIGNWDLSLNTRQAAMFKHAYAFYQDITGWSTASDDQHTGTCSPRRRVARPHAAHRRRLLPSDGPSNVWVHKPCLVNERAQSGWCVPCGGGGIRPAGDDPSSGDTMCAFPDKPRSRPLWTRASRRCRAVRRAARRTRTARIRARRGAGARAAWICPSGTCRR